MPPGSGIQAICRAYPSVFVFESDICQNPARLAHDAARFESTVRENLCEFLKAQATGRCLDQRILLHTCLNLNSNTLELVLEREDFVRRVAAENPGTQGGIPTVVARWRDQFYDWYSVRYPDAKSDGRVISSARLDCLLGLIAASRITPALHVAEVIQGKIAMTAMRALHFHEAADVLKFVRSQDPFCLIYYPNDVMYMKTVALAGLQAPGTIISVLRGTGFTLRVNEASFHRVCGNCYHRECDHYVSGRFCPTPSRDIDLEDWVELHSDSSLPPSDYVLLYGNDLGPWRNTLRFDPGRGPRRFVTLEALDHLANAFANVDPNIDRDPYHAIPGLD